MTRLQARHHGSKRRSQPSVLPSADSVEGLNEIWTNKHAEWLQVVDALQSLGEGWISHVHPRKMTRQKFAEYHVLLDGFRDLIKSWISYILAARAIRSGAEERIRAAHSHVVCLERRLRTARRCRDAALKRSLEAERERNDALQAKIAMAESSQRKEEMWKTEKARSQPLQILLDNQASQLRTLRMQQSKHKADTEALHREHTLAIATLKLEHEKQLTSARSSGMLNGRHPLDAAGFASPAQSSDHSQASNGTVSFDTWRATLAERDHLAGRCHLLEQQINELQRRPKAANEDVKKANEVKEKYDKLKLEWHKLVDKKEALSLQVEKAKGELECVNANLAAERAANQAVKTDLAALNAKLELAAQHTRDVEKQHLASEAERDIAISRLEQMGKEKDAVQLRVAALEAATGEEAKHAVQQARLEDELADTTRRLTILQARELEHTSLRTQLETQIESLEQSEADLTAALRRATARAVDLSYGREMRKNLEAAEVARDEALRAKDVMENSAKFLQGQWDLQCQAFKDEIAQLQRKQATVFPETTELMRPPLQIISRDNQMLELQTQLHAKNGQLNKLKAALEKNKAAISILLEEQLALGQ